MINNKDDEDFEEYFNGLHGENPEEQDGLRDCQKRLLLDILSVKLDYSTSLLNTLSSKGFKHPDKSDRISELLEISTASFEQLDYLMGTLIDEIDKECKDEH